jgi:diguanylate cyclase (GGDEF)-like protein/PAS domain S-box-containing protein
MTERPVHNVTRPDGGLPRSGREKTQVTHARVPEPPAVDMDAIAAAVLVCSADAIVVDLNGAAADLLQVDRDAVIGASLTEVRQWAGTWVTESGELIEPAASSVASLAFSGQRVEGEVFGLRAEHDGSPATWLRIAAEPLVSPTGALENVVITLVDITMLKETRDALETTAAELRELVRALPDTYLYVDGGDVVRRVVGARGTGHHTPRPLTTAGPGDRVWGSLPEDAADRLRKAAALARATGKPVTAEIVTVTPTTILYDEVRHLPREDGSLLLVVRDVTDSRRAAESLRQSEEKYRTLYLRTPVMLHSIDAEGRLLSVSHRWLQRLGYTADEVLGRRSTEFFTEESRRYANDVVLPDFFASGSCEDVPYQMVAKDGSLVDVLLSATSERDSSGAVIRSLSVLVDVTEQRKASRDLAESDRARQTLLANIPGMAYRCSNDPDWTMQLMSDGCFQVTGYRPEELLGASSPTWGDVILSEDSGRVWDDIQAALAERDPWTITYRIRTRDGHTRWVWERGTGVFAADGELLHLEGFISDITGLRTTENALREREQTLSAIVASLPGAVYRSELRDPWRTTFLSEGFRTLFGRDPGAVTGGELLWRDVVHPDDVDMLGTDMDRDLAAGSPTTQSEYRIVTAQGESRWVLDRAMFVRGEDGEPTELIGVLFDVTDVREAREAQATSHLLLHDPVTGLANRALLEDRVGQALKHAQRKRLSFGLAAFRLDRFDVVESSLGHKGTDALLGGLGRRLQQAVRAEDTVAYLGAGSFAALLPGAAGPAEATAAVSGLLTAVGEPLTVNGRELYLTLSLGVALCPTDGAAAAELLRNADAAMRQASDGGGNRWQFFHPGLNEEQADRLALEAELHRALKGDQLFLEYQPLVAADTEEIIGVEALVRWRHPQRGVLPPMEFIPVAEETGVLGQIGGWLLDEACRQGRAWQRRLGRPLRVSVNIGGRQLHDQTLVATVRRTLQATGFDPCALELEITETAAMRDARHTAQVLGALRAMGVRVALDDFGTGYSSLSHLVRLPVSTVKIDRSFVRDLLSVPEHAAVAASVIALGHRLGLTVVAEGVETIGERSVLRTEGCDVIQGFLYAPPLSAEACGELLDAGVIHR